MCVCVCVCVRCDVTCYMSHLIPQGEIRPDSATSTLTIYEGTFTRLKEERENVIKAKEALELAEPGLN